MDCKSKHEYTSHKCELRRIYKIEIYVFVDSKIFCLNRPKKKHLYFRLPQFQLLTKQEELDQLKKISNFGRGLNCLFFKSAGVKWIFRRANNEVSRLSQPRDEGGVRREEGGE